MKFIVQDLLLPLELDVAAPGDAVELVVSGNLLDGTPFAASDCITLVPPAAPPGLISVLSNVSGSWKPINLRAAVDVHYRMVR